MKKESLKDILKEQEDKISLSKEEKKIISNRVAILKKELEESIKRNKIKAEVFIGGSFVKNTLIKRDRYDIDIFIRFDKVFLERSKGDISDLLNKILKSKANQRIHGSRDYFLIKEKEMEFEIIPTLRISKPKEAENTTDLSFFHVKYVLGKIKKDKNIAKEIAITKAFLHGCECYGAESYIMGFSGYAVELLIIKYKTLVNFLKNMTKPIKGKIIIDIERDYKNDKEVMIKINEAKLQSPIILIDPTFKERNALASLSDETFLKFRDRAKKFLEKPSLNYFIIENKENKMKSKFKDLEIIKIKTDKQAGDIAGTKLKKFYEFFVKQAQKYFIINSDFEYKEKENQGIIYISAKAKSEIEFPGPPLDMKEKLEEFKRQHKSIKIKDKRALAFEKNPYNRMKEFVNFTRNSKEIENRSITNIEMN
jgi:tRNA nucleotidyltransferase (CCA-adding enzyme)